MMSLQRRFRGGPVALATLVGIGALALVLFSVLLSGHPAENTLRFEAAKICLQVFGLVVLGGVVGLATSDIEYQREAQAEQRQRQEESFKVRTDLLDRTARCAATMYVTCRHVERLIAAADPALSASDEEWTPDLSVVPEDFDDNFLAFAAEGLTLQTEIEARFATRESMTHSESEPQPGDAPVVEAGEASLRWHQVYDLLTLYYFSLVDGIDDDVIMHRSREHQKYHSGIDCTYMLESGATRSREQLDGFRKTVRDTYVRAMPSLTDALLREPLKLSAP